MYLIHDKKDFVASIRITRAVPDDAEGIKNVQYHTWLATYPNAVAGITADDIEDRFKDRTTPEAIQKQRERLARPEAGITVFVAKDREKIVGACAVKTASDHNQLNMLYVLPEYQGKKIGWSLWEEGRKMFDNTNPTFVHVVDYNTYAIRFYERLGFRDTGERHENPKFTMKSGARIREIKMILETKN